MVKRAKEDWIRVNDTHQAIISMELWDKVQIMSVEAKKKAENQRPRVKSLFSKLLFCKDCGKSMAVRIETHTRKSGRKVTYHSYKCSTACLAGTSVCTYHNIYELSLKQILIANIQQQANELFLDEQAMLTRLQTKLLGQTTVDRAYNKKMIRVLEQRLHKLESETTMLYEQRVNGKLSDEKFTQLIDANISEKQEKEERLAAYNQEENNIDDKLSDIQKWSKLIRNYSTFNDVDRDLLDSLIEKIEIGERYVVNGERHQDIKIYYKFVGLI